jgi:hypothetical protein
LAITAFFLVERARLGDLTQRFRNSPRAIIPGRIAYLAVDLQPFGIERVLVIRSAFESGKARVATTSVMGCCALTDKPSDFVAALTADGPLSAVIATTSWLPEFPTDPQERTDDMWLVERGEDGQVLQSRRYADTLPIESEDAQ